MKPTEKIKQLEAKIATLEGRKTELGAQLSFITLKQFNAIKDVQALAEDCLHLNHIHARFAQVAGDEGRTRHGANAAAFGGMLDRLQEIIRKYTSPPDRGQQISVATDGIILWEDGSRTKPDGTSAD